MPCYVSGMNAWMPWEATVFFVNVQITYISNAVKSDPALVGSHQGENFHSFKQIKGTMTKKKKN